MYEKLQKYLRINNTPHTAREKIAPGTTFAGPFAETAAFVREEVAAGRMDRDTALRLSNQAYMDTMHAQLQGFPVETDSIELPEQVFPPVRAPLRKTTIFSRLVRRLQKPR